MNGYLMALAGACVGTVALVGAIVIGLSAIDSSIQGQISEIQTQIDNPTLQNDLSIVTNRENMLAGFQSYNDNVGSTSSYSTTCRGADLHHQ